ncbi:transmembrane protein 17-like isoform X3 [Bacillus rossius redtenbacheri]|uniref:transmembrane protein 17-like isoform X3 n=1 Tax=Bacillus rossius redtenbacheri TaxID=93214 RepID=UPI002FDDB075
MESFELYFLLMVNDQFQSESSYLRKEAYLPGHGYTPSLPLQMSLYFNIFFLPVWLITLIVILPVKYECLSDIYRFITVTVVVAVIVVECLRLYLGYLGNVSEQLPLQLFLTLNQRTAPQLVEVAVQLVMLALLLVQLVTGLAALGRAGGTSRY